MPVGQEYELDLICKESNDSFEDSVVLKLALEKLDDDECQIVLLRLSGMKAREIGLLLGMPRGTVSWKYSEALKKLRKILTKGEGK